jgi:hypothetical protein
MSKQSAIEARIAALEPIELSPYERLRMEHRFWDDRAGEALQRTHIIQRTLKQFDEQERNILPFESVHAKAQEIAALHAEIELLENIRKGAQARADRLWMDVQNSGQNVPPRVLQFRLLRADLYQVGIRMQELSSVMPQNRQPNFDETYAQVQDKFVRISRELEQYGDVEQVEELNRRVRNGDRTPE